MKFVASLLVVLWIISGPYSYAETTPTQVGELPVSIRLGPGYDYPSLRYIDPSTMLTAVGQTEAGDWVKVEDGNVTGWVAASGLVSLPTEVPTIDSFPPAPDVNYEQCVSLIGDSVAYGDVVYMVPGHGFGVLRLEPLSVTLDRALTEVGLGFLQVRDRTASAAFLSADGKTVYADTDAYADSMADQCRSTVIMPWINDLSVDRENPADAHIEDMRQFMTALTEANAEGQILVLGFYSGQRADFVENFAPGYVSDNIQAHEDALIAACEPDGAWSVIENLTCMATEPLFSELGNAHVVLNATQATLQDLLYEPIPDDVASFFEVYWRDNPSGEVIGDGVHLSDLGKQVLVDAIIDRFFWMDPDL